MNKILHNKGIVIVLIIATLTALADLISTLVVGRVLLPYLEANPIYKYTGLGGIIAINVLYLMVYYWLYTTSSKPRNRFIFMNILITTILVRILVVHNNIQVALNPPSLEMAMQVTEAMKQAALIKIGSMAVLPFIAGILSFLFFKLDHEVEIKNGHRKMAEECQ